MNKRSKLSGVSSCRLKPAGKRI